MGKFSEQVWGDSRERGQFHVAAAVDANGGVLGVETFDTTTHGYRELVAWLAGFGTVRLVGVEGTGSYGAGICRHLVGKGIAVVEVDRPNRQARHRAGKTDSVDAIAAARAALTGTATGVPKSRTGKIEAIRVIMVARRSAGDEWISIINQMRHLVFCAPDEIRARFLDLSPIKLARTCATLRPRRSDDDIVRFTTLSTLRELGRRALFVREQKDRLSAEMRPLINEFAPALIEMKGVGYDTAAKLLIAAGDNPHRIRSEAAWAHLCGVAPIPASSGKTQRHRLNRGGNRHANSAIYRIMLTRMANDERTRNYIARRSSDGKTMGEIARMLKRYIAREVYKTLPTTI
ncbi:MAG: IS110 family transposase [Ilumatobacteraceae bacterium]